MDLLGALRLCANVPGQFAIDAALHGAGHDHAAVRAGRPPVRNAPRGDRSAAPPASTWSWSRRPARCTRFPAVVGDAAHGFDDHAFALELLETEDVLVVPGSQLQRALPQPFPRDAAAGGGRCCAKCSRASTACSTRRADARQRARRSRGGLSAVGADARRRQLRYLALGDSYTIGEGVAPDGALAGAAGARRCATTASRWPTRASSPPPAGPPTNSTRRSTPPQPLGRCDLRQPADRRQQPVPRPQRRRLPRASSRALLRARDRLRRRPRRPRAGAVDPRLGRDPVRARRRARRRARSRARLDAFNAAARAICDARGVAFVDITPVSRAARRANRRCWPTTACIRRRAMYAQWTRLALPVARGCWRRDDATPRTAARPRQRRAHRPRLPAGALVRQSLALLLQPRQARQRSAVSGRDRRAARQRRAAARPGLRHRPARACVARRRASRLPYRGVDNDAAKIAQARRAAGAARACATSRSTSSTWPRACPRIAAASRSSTCCSSCRRRRRTRSLDAAIAMLAPGARLVIRTGLDDGSRACAHHAPHRCAVAHAAAG